MANDDKGMEILLLSLLKIFTSCNDLKYELSIKIQTIYAWVQ